MKQPQQVMMIADKSTAIQPLWSFVAIAGDTENSGAPGSHGLPVGDTSATHAPPALPLTLLVRRLVARKTCR
jgi:hypothetical protein